MKIITASLTVGFLLGLTPFPVAAQAPLAELPRLGLNPESTSVIGVSSGGYMATQLAVAWPSRFAGLGVLAAGPWGCARGALSLALGQCMKTRLGAPDLTALAARHRDYLERDLVGSLKALASLRAFVWQGGEDDVIAPSLGKALSEQLSGWLADPEAQLRYVETDGAGHGWPIDYTPSVAQSEQDECRSGSAAYLLACDLDIAGEALTWLHGKLSAPAPDTTPAGNLTEFDQSAFDTKGFAENGYLFVPEGCERGGCDLTIALHGCGMASETLGDTFVRHNGLNTWAGENHRVVLYPQAETSLANPQGCWDWWGFTESTWQLDPLHDSRQGSQVAALMAMIDRLEAPVEQDSSR
jgi:poly(3-hydroxybutyrate) depolymerase